MIFIKTPEEISLMREGGKILAYVLNQVAAKVEPGIRTILLDKFAEELALKYGATPSFKGYEPTYKKKNLLGNRSRGDISQDQGFPASLCVSVNEEVVHGIPGERILKQGDIVSLDMGISYKGYYTDAAITVGVGKISRQSQHLISVTKRALEIAIARVRPKARLGDIGEIVEKYVKVNGFSVVRQLVGHGVGKFIHEDPEVPNYGQKGKGLKLEKGMTLAIEPMVTIGTGQVNQSSDGWTFVTADKSLVAHFEHTVVVTEDECEVLTRL